MHIDSQEFEVWASNCPIVSKENWVVGANMSLHGLRFYICVLTGVRFGTKSLYGKIRVSFQNKLTPQEEWKSFAKLSGPLEYLRENTNASVGAGLLPWAPAIVKVQRWVTAASKAPE